MSLTNQIDTKKEKEANNVEMKISEKATKKKSKKTDECIELKNIQYKTMLLNGVQKEIKISKTEADIEDILEKEKNLNLSVPWTKLEKGIKIRKLICFAEQYGIDNSLTTDELVKLTNLLKTAIDRKHLQRMKDITYDKETGVIVDIPLLSFDEKTRNFVLRRQEKKSTQKSFTPFRKKSVKSKTSKQGKAGKQAKSGKTTRTKQGKERKNGHNKTSKSPPARTLKKKRESSKSTAKANIVDSD